MPFVDRRDAGRRLADRLTHLRDDHVVVLGLPRGGVPVAAEVARALGAPLDVVVVRKLGVPWQPELAMGAIGEGGVRVVDEDLVRRAGVSREQLEAVEEAEAAELDRRVRRFRHRHHRVDLRGRTAVVVDDGLATGSTARAACRVVRALGASRVVLAVPVAPRGWQRTVAAEVDEAVAVEEPRHLLAIGQFYDDFAQVGDDEVIRCLAAVDPVTSSFSVDDDVTAEVETGTGVVLLPGHLRVPRDAYGLVVFAHGSGSSRHSPRNRYVADRLSSAGLGTFLVDLLSADEERVAEADPHRAAVFDVEGLAERLTGVTAWARSLDEARDVRVGWFGASTGAAAALWAASQPGADVAAIVSRGGRPDLAARRLYAVTAPTLLVVGGADELVLELNRQAAALLHCRHELVVVGGAAHLFTEEGALEEVAEHARRWFSRYLLPG